MPKPPTCCPCTRCCSVRFKQQFGVRMKRLAPSCDFWLQLSDSIFKGHVLSFFQHIQKVPHELMAFVKLRNLDIFVGLMGLSNIAGSANDCRIPCLLELPRLGAIGNNMRFIIARELPRQSFSQSLSVVGKGFVGGVDFCLCV